MAYSGQEAVRAAQEQASRYRAEAQRLKEAIVEHYRQVHRGNWGHDDELWAAVGLVADHTVVG